MKTQCTISRYDELPTELQKSLNELVYDRYSKRMHDKNLYLAAIMILNSAQHCHVDKETSDACLSYFGKRTVKDEFEMAMEYVNRRSNDEWVCIVFKGNKVLSTMTLTPFRGKHNIPSLKHVRFPTTDIPDATGVSFGRLASWPGAELFSSYNYMLALHTMVEWGEANNILPDQDSIICGETHSYVLNMMKKAFPIKLLPTTLNTDFDMAASCFIQRYVLGSFRDREHMQEVLNSMPLVQRNVAVSLIESSLGSLDRFNTGLYNLQYFYFDYNSPDTKASLSFIRDVVETENNKL